MKEISLIQSSDPLFPPLLKHIVAPPSELYVRGNIKRLHEISQENSGGKILAVVGSRKHTQYGKEVTERLIAGLKGYNICIVSGLALGIDSIAHRAALENGLYTVAFPGSGLNRSVMHPKSHLGLADEIVKSGGALISSFEPEHPATKWTFPSRNRLMSGISHATLVIEAGLQSGTLITSRQAMEHYRDVAAVPGDIFSPLSAGPHLLIRDGATPVTSVDDLLELLGFARREGQSVLPFSTTPDDPRLSILDEHEKKIMLLLSRGAQSKDALVREFRIDPRELNAMISSLEIEGFIHEDGGMVSVV